MLLHLRAACSCLVLLASADALACSFPTLVRTDVLPADGATAVPTNALVRVQYEGSDGWAFGELDAQRLQIRPVGGDAVEAEVEVARLRDGMLVSLRAAAALTPRTEYEILDFFAGDSCTSDECAVAEAVRVSGFTTGDGPDEQAPTFTGLTGFSTQADSCEDDACCGPYQVVVVHPTFEEALDDGGDAASIRYRLYRREAGALSLVVGAGEPGLPLTAWVGCSGSPLFNDETGHYELAGGEYVLRAVDLAGNEDANDAGATLDVRCEDFAFGDGGDGGDADADADADAEAGGDGAHAAGGGGCGVLPGLPAGPGLLLLAAAAAALEVGRRRRLANPSARS